MSLECPNGHGRQNVVKNITANLDIPKRSSDVIAVTLACGCTVGGEEYQAFAAEVQWLKNQEAEEAAALRKKYNGKKAVALKAFITKGDN